MSLWKNIGTGVGSFGIYPALQALSGGGKAGAPPAMRPPMQAGDIKIDPTLAASIGGVGTGAYNAIGSNYAGAKSKLAGEASTLGMSPTAMTGPNSYAGQRLAATQALDQGNLETALGGGLGNTAYSNAKELRGYGQDTALANEIGALNKPDMLQEVLGGVGNVGGTAAQIYGMYGKNKAKPIGAGDPSPLSLYNDSAPNEYMRYMGGY